MLLCIQAEWMCSLGSPIIGFKICYFFNLLESFGIQNSCYVSSLSIMTMM